MVYPLIVDLHLDLAWNALFWNRNLSLSAQEVRHQETDEDREVASGYGAGRCTVTFPELRRGNVGIVLSTIMSRIDARNHFMRDGMRTQEQAIAIGRGHLAYYEAMTRKGEMKPIRTCADLQQAVDVWKTPTATTPIYYILSMESADPIMDPEDVQFWWDAGLRVVGPAHFGHNTYIHGTNSVGGLKSPAKALFKAMREAGMILDITHMADVAVWESFDLWDGPIMATHCVSRSIVRGQRHLTDDMIRELIRRKGVIGLVFCQWFLDPDIVWEEKPPARSCERRHGMKSLIPHIEHIASLAGGSIENIAVGTDLDGGFGAELAPRDLDTIADLRGFIQVLRDAGYSELTIDAILHGNVLRFLSNVWKPSMG
jgi:membrane dipeptidase